MDDSRQSSEIPAVSGTPDAGRALDEASAFLRRLIAFPGSQSVGPLSFLPVDSRGSAAQADPIGTAAATVEGPASSIVAQAASVLDEEMARGVLAARDGAGTGSWGRSNATTPLLRQAHEFVDNLAALLPSLQGGTAQSPSTQRAPAGDAGPLVKVGPPAPVKPGEQVTISMTLRNSESKRVHLVPMATDLLGSRGGRIASTQFKFVPSEITLDPEGQESLTISTTVPAEATPGWYSGLLVIGGLDYLRALITIEVAGTTPSSESPEAPTPPRTAMPSAGTPSATSSATAPHVGNPNTSWRGAGTGLDPPARNETLPSHKNMMQEAVKLAEDGELGNSDAIRLLQIPHGPADVKDVLARFEQQLTREAKSKLTLEAFVPLPDGVDNQRFEPFFDRYPVTGKTYTTANGTVALNEVQFYNGEMVQLYGECSNVEQVRGSLAGSEYRPLTVRHADGRETAIAHFWSQELTDTSLRPYNSAFIIVPAVPDSAVTDRSWYTADKNGVSSVLSMFDGAYDPAKGTYENRSRLFYVRLLDSTQIAIDVGRERMGTDKRPGTVQITRTGKRRSFSVADGAGNPVSKIDFVIADDSKGCLAEIATAAATAGMPFHPPPAGTEYVYPTVARIGSGPIVDWQWRTGVPPRLQRVEPNTVTFDSRSEEGEILIGWGFEPRLLGYIPNVRGAVTGLP